MLKKLLPLFSIFALILAATAAASLYKEDFGLSFIMMTGMGFFFLVFGTFKVANLNGFVQAYAMYGVLAMRSRSYAYAYPFIEVALGLMYLFSLGGAWRDAFAFVLMVVGAYGVWKALRVKEEIPCACLGAVFKVPMTKVTLFENLAMALMALYMLVGHFMGGIVHIWPPSL